MIPKALQGKTKRFNAKQGKTRRCNLIWAFCCSNCFSKCCINLLKKNEQFQQIYAYRKHQFEEKITSKNCTILWYASQNIAHQNKRKERKMKKTYINRYDFIWSAMFCFFIPFALCAMFTFHNFLRASDNLPVVFHIRVHRISQEEANVSLIRSFVRFTLHKHTTWTHYRVWKRNRITITTTALQQIFEAHCFIYAWRRPCQGRRFIQRDAVAIAIAIAALLLLLFICCVFFHSIPLFGQCTITVCGVVLGRSVDWCWCVDLWQHWRITIVSANKLADEKNTIPNCIGLHLISSLLLCVRVCESLSECVCVLFWSTD